MRFDKAMPQRAVVNRSRCSRYGRSSTCLLPQKLVSKLAQAFEETRMSSVRCGIAAPTTSSLHLENPRACQGCYPHCENSVSSGWIQRNRLVRFLQSRPLIFPKAWNSSAPRNGCPQWHSLTDLRYLEGYLAVSLGCSPGYRSVLQSQVDLLVIGSGRAKCGLH